MLGDEAAKRNPRDVRASDLVTGQQFTKLCRKVFDCVGPVGNSRAAVPRQIVRHEGEVVRERVRKMPEVVVDAEAMQQDEGGSRAALLQRDGVGIEYRHLFFHAGAVARTSIPSAL